MSVHFTSTTLGIGEKVVLLVLGGVATFKVLPTLWALALVAGTITSWILWTKRSYSFWSDLGIPGPKPVFMFGNMLEFKKKGVHEVDMELTQKYGKLIGTYVLQQPDLVVSDVNLLKSILVKDFGTFTNRRQFVRTDNLSDADKARRQRRMDRTVLGNMVTTMTDDKWKTVRSTITPSFTTGKLKQVLPLIHDCSETLLQKLGQVAATGESFDVKECFGNYTMDVIASVALATKIDSQNNPDNPVVKHAKTFTSGGMFSPRLLFAILFPWTATRFEDWFGFHFVSAEADDFFMHTLTKLMQERRRKGEKHQDFLQLLLDAHEDDSEEGEAIGGKTKTGPEIVSQCLLFLLAGFETSASTLQFVAYELAMRQDVQENCYKEIQQLLPDNERITYELLSSKFSYVESVILETLRFYPPSVRFDRNCGDAYELNGVILPKNTTISVPIYVIHHSSEHYPDPEEFLPERFSPENRATRNPYTFLAFGHGPRNCIGMRFALLEIKHAVIDVLRKFTLLPADTTEKPPLQLACTTFLTPKNAIHLKIRSRQNIE